MQFVSHDWRFVAALFDRVLELTPEGVQRYGGAYVYGVYRAYWEGGTGGAPGRSHKLLMR
jgi:hypothetical protein